MKVAILIKADGEFAPVKPANGWRFTWSEICDLVPHISGDPDVFHLVDGQPDEDILVMYHGEWEPDDEDLPPLNFRAVALWTALGPDFGPGYGSAKFWGDVLVCNLEQSDEHEDLPVPGWEDPVDPNPPVGGIQ